MEDGIREAKKKRFNTSNLLRVSLRKLLSHKCTLITDGTIQVSFVSEAAVDTGGPLERILSSICKGGN